MDDHSTIHRYALTFNFKFTYVTYRNVTSKLSKKHKLIGVKLKILLKNTTNNSLKILLFTCGQNRTKCTNN